MFIHMEKGPSFEDFQNECLAYNLKNGHCALSYTCILLLLSIQKQQNKFIRVLRASTLRLLNFLVVNTCEMMWAILLHLSLDQNDKIGYNYPGLSSNRD